MTDVRPATWAAPPPPVDNRDAPECPMQLIDETGAGVRSAAGAGITMPPDRLLVELFTRMVIGRRLDIQATALTKQGRLAVYPSARGQEACEIGASAALREQDWLFPTYRDTMAVLDRGVDATEAFSLLRGAWHCGYDPYRYRVAPQCTPLATNALHAVGFAHAARLRGQDTVALVFMGDGATSEGDAHEAFNVAAVWKAPVVFVVVNNGFAISVPRARQCAAPTLAARAPGYGMPGRLVDGNDVSAVYAVITNAIAGAADGSGPTLIEALTYRMEPHTNADDAGRYRTAEQVAEWAARDPLERLQRFLVARGLLTDDGIAELNTAADKRANDLRDRINGVGPEQDPSVLFAHVYARPSPALRTQEHILADELT